MQRDPDGLTFQSWPLDPQIGGLPAHGVIEEFDRAAKEIKKDPANIHRWQPIIAKYSPALVGTCQKAIDWTNQLVEDWLTTGMFEGDSQAVSKAKRVVRELGSHEITKSHARHISMERARELDLTVAALEDDDALQDAVLTVHHACLLTLAGTGAIKIIENHKGIALMQMAQIAGQPAPR